MGNSNSSSSNDVKLNDLEGMVMLSGLVISPTVMLMLVLSMIGGR